jgi:hypothetical protein
VCYVCLLLVCLETRAPPKQTRATDAHNTYNLSLDV